VFQQTWPITMVGLDVTNRVIFSRADREALQSNTEPGAILLREVTRYLFDVRGEQEMALHDPLALLVAFHPDLVTTVHRDVFVETQGEHTPGQTLVDLRPSASPPTRKTKVCVDVDVERARALFFGGLL